MPYPATTVLTAEAIVDDADTFVNARLWDYRPLGTTLDQLQTVRQYYDFTDVDIDRYIIDGKQRQVMLSAREMAIDRNPTAANWLNTHFVYTHGYGVAMVPVNAVQPDGLPDLIIRDMPVVSRAGAPDDDAAAHLLRRATVAVGRSRAPRPTSSTILAMTPPVTPPRAGPAPPASTSATASTGCC